MTVIATAGVGQIRPRTGTEGDALSTAPSIQPRSVVCSEVNPKPATMIWRWLLSCASIRQGQPSVRRTSGPHTEFVTFLAQTMTQSVVSRLHEGRSHSRDHREEEEEPRLRIFQALNESRQGFKASVTPRK